MTLADVLYALWLAASFYWLLRWYLAASTDWLFAVRRS